MYTIERRLREDKYKQERKYPSFSSTLLNQIYRSIDDDKGGTTIKKEDMKFYRDTMGKKQSTKVGHHNKARRHQGDEEMMKIQHPRLIEKYMERKVSVKSSEQERRKVWKEFHQGKYSCPDDHEQDASIFSSGSSSFDSSSGGFSSSDTESVHGLKPTMSCFVPSRPKPVRTTVPTRSEKKSKTQKQEKALKTEQKQRSLHTFDDYHYNSASDQIPKLDDSTIKSKSRALQIYSNLKKMKQPISPGGRLTSFLNNLFTAGRTKKPKHPSSVGGYDETRAERKYNSGQISNCSSATSFSRSCLSKNSPSTREKLRNSDKRTVRFSPVSVILDEDSRPCGQKNLYEEQNHSSLMPVSVPTAWRIGKSPSRKIEEDVKCQVMERSKRIEDMAREFLKDYRYAANHNKNNVISRDVIHKHFDVQDDEDDDASSCSSSDLFELDHLSVLGKDRYNEELPVYETTRVDTNRVINSLLM